jgi:hypothetical protein
MDFDHIHLDTPIFMKCFLFNFYSFCFILCIFSFHMATQGAAVSLVELGEYEKASTFLEKLIKVC